MTELKPCPFCGGKAALKTKTTAIGKVYSEVICDMCGARTYPFEISTEYSSDEKATEDWNRRTYENQTENKEGS